MAEPSEPVCRLLLWPWTLSGAVLYTYSSAFFVSYEVQLESKVRRKGLGKFLIQILQLMANR